MQDVIMAYTVLMEGVQICATTKLIQLKRTHCFKIKILEKMCFWILFAHPHAQVGGCTLYQFYGLLYSN